MAVPGNAGPWTVAKLLASMQAYFASRHIASARLDAELLLGRTLGVSRIYLYTHLDQPISAEERAVLRGLTLRRAAYEPMAYILGTQEFYSRDFVVNADVLIPRPETEHVVEAALRWAGSDREKPLRVLDVGTGCGTLAVTLAAELPNAEVVATDMSAAALAVARTNATAHSVSGRLTWHCGDVFAALPSATPPFDMIVSNPPYITTAARSSLPPDVVRYEPAGALFSGADGLGVLRQLCADAPRWLKPQGFFATEIGYDQGARVPALLAGGGWDAVAAVLDLQGHQRVVTARRGAAPAPVTVRIEGPEDQRDTHGRDLDLDTIAPPG
jgi:release factor glutamine methyltransferase